MDDHSLPPKPYETYLSDMLTRAMQETSPGIRSVVVRGRICTVDDGGEITRYLIPAPVLLRALGASMDSNVSVGEVTLLPYDDQGALEAFHDGLTWVDGPRAHWCLEPDTCPDAAAS